MTSYLVRVPPAVLDAAEKRGEYKPNAIWKVSAFASKHPLLRGLVDGGDLFLVTVSMLNFVTLRAILEAPVFEGGAWKAKPNQVSSRALQLQHLSFAQGKGPNFKKQLKKLLLTPQPLTVSDERVLRNGIPRSTKLPVLHVLADSRPRSISDLDSIQLKQLRAAGRGHDGKNLPAERRLAPRKPRAPDANESFARYLRIVKLGNEKNEHLYDVFMCSPDSGSVFRAGTTKLVAELIQGGMQGGDATLREALKRALAKPTPRRAKSSKS